MNPRSKPKQITEKDIRLLDAKESSEVEQVLINLDILALNNEAVNNTQGCPTASCCSNIF